MNNRAIEIAKKAHLEAIKAADSSSYKHQSSGWNQVYQQTYLETSARLESGAAIGNEIAPERYDVTITELNQINTTSPEGKLLVAAIGLITGSYERKQTPNAIILALNEVAERTFGEVPA